MGAVTLVSQSWNDGFAASDLNALASGSQFTSTLTAPQVDNSSGANLYAEFEVNLAALSPTTGAHIIVFLVPEISSGGSYMTGDDGTTTANQVRWQNFPYAIVSLTLKASTAQLQQSGLVQLQAKQYKIGIINRSGSALAASGNMVRWRFVTESVAG